MVRDAPLKKRGFALQLEMVLYMMAVAVLIGGAVHVLNGYSWDSKVARAKADLSTIAVAMNQYAYEMQAAPNAISILGKSATRNNVTYGPWIQRESPKDPWGGSYQIIQVQETLNSQTFYVGYIVYCSCGGSGTATLTKFTADTNKRLGYYVSAADNVIAYYGRYGSPLTTLKNN